jgi:hypothetical protein
MNDFSQSLWQEKKRRTSQEMFQNKETNAMK